MYGVPLIFDEVQTGFGATGIMWAHGHFGLPAPPDAVRMPRRLPRGMRPLSSARVQSARSLTSLTSMMPAW